MAENEALEHAVNGAPTDEPTRCRLSAAVKVQKVFRGHVDRRKLADSAVLDGQNWWQALDFAKLNISTTSFYKKPETAASRWNRVGSNASKVGKGLSLDAKAQKLIFEHWIEAIDPKHRYGKNLYLYFEEWRKSDSEQPFFYWLDLGDGKEVDLQDCPKSKLQNQCIKYLGPVERENYEYSVVGGKILHKLTGEPLDTNQGSTWNIFVMSVSKRLYSAEKKRGQFHHSSFLAGGATLAAGMLVAKDGELKSISAYSGHYKPTDDSFETFLSFLEENGVDLSQVEIRGVKGDQVPDGSGKFLKSDSAIYKNATSESANRTHNLGGKSNRLEETPPEVNRLIGVKLVRFCLFGVDFVDGEGIGENPMLQPSDLGATSCHLRSSMGNAPSQFDGRHSGSRVALPLAGLLVTDSLTRVDILQTVSFRSPANRKKK
ncbi:IQ calmodulin-binding motif family protein [Striga hermonthica]|uniref:IQ calmodulin-binding motif family protein n=1 Tax=Striga hermonthica TaxID=68872 RepID=A0A9N7P583_STRHE|nr:IQ calmodulin-binding motif family protein [Striga hermonthica]